MLINELRELTSKSKLYQEEYKGIVKKLRVAARSGLNKVTIIDMSDKVRNRLEKEGLTVIHKYELAFGPPTSYDIIKW